MRAGPVVSRRALIRLIPALCLSVLGLVLAGRRWRGATASAPEPDTAPSSPFDLGDLAPLGAAYLELRPEEADAARLRALLELGDVDLAGLMRAPAAPLRARLDRAHREDFRDGSVVKLRGWTLSETELRLAALAHLGG